MDLAVVIATERRLAANRERLAAAGHPDIAACKRGACANCAKVVAGA